jgi:hypothetical protein
VRTSCGGGEFESSEAANCT